MIVQSWIQSTSELNRGSASRDMPVRLRVIIVSSAEIFLASSNLWFISSEKIPAVYQSLWSILSVKVNGWRGSDLPISATEARTDSHLDEGSGSHSKDASAPATRIFSPLAVAGLCVVIGCYWYLFKRLTPVSAARFYRFEHIVAHSSGKVVAK